MLPCLKDMPTLPSQTVHIWEYFITLSSRRTWSESGPYPISFHDIAAWQGITCIKLEKWELDALIQIDKVWLEQI